MTRLRLPQRFGGGLCDEPPPTPRLFLSDAVLKKPLSDLDQVSVPVARRLAALGLETLGDLIGHLPRRYHDYRDRKHIRDLQVGEEATVRGVVLRVSAERTARRRVDVVRVLLKDETGALDAVWFNQRYLLKVVREGARLSVRGVFRFLGRRASFVVKSHELLDDDEEEGLHTDGIVPVYPAGERVSARQLRDLLIGVRPLMRLLPDPLPAELRVCEGLPSRADALLAAHQPRDPEEAGLSRQRLVLEELLLMQLGLLAYKREQQSRVQAVPFPPPAELTRAYLEALPFAFTSYQRTALEEIEADLRGTTPMRRLLQGDVGSGKTVVALHCLVRAAEAGLQGVLLAPTETLAAQHAETAERLLSGLVGITRLTASISADERRAALAGIAGGGSRLVIGTHAVLQEDVAYADLGLLVVDEQHRFGVEQRDALVRRAERSGRAPHVLHMTATPIPRTLALTAYGDLDVTVIAGVPEGRQPVTTRLVDDARREEGYAFVRGQLAKGRQAYVVCPAIEESAAIDAATAVAEAERLRAGPFHGLRVAVVHGQLKASERGAVMQAFTEGEIQVLVATSLIEVGIDVPNATVMIVEGAERFGLAQLHQLRGRVGRGAERSFCLLFARAETGASQARLEALLETTDGFELADRDLEIRGEGKLMGARQAGASDLKLARLARDRAVLRRAREMAEDILSDDPGLDDPRHRPLRDAVAAAFGADLAWLLKA